MVFIALHCAPQNVAQTNDVITTLKDSGAGLIAGHLCGSGTLVSDFGSISYAWNESSGSGRGSGSSG